jgi:methylmalonyl-CoA/ethylmalonyl-CoA epimerase
VLRLGYQRKRGYNIEEIKTKKSPFSNIEHLSIVVRDIDKAVEYYQSLGIGPFEPTGFSITDKKRHGKPVTADVKQEVRVAQMGQIKLALFQPVSGETDEKKFLESRGEGIQHMAFRVDDIDRETAKLEEKGFKVVFSGRFVNGGGFAYFDTDKVGGVVFELVEPPPE